MRFRLLSCLFIVGILGQAFGTEEAVDTAPLQETAVQGTAVQGTGVQGTADQRTVQELLYDGKGLPRLHLYDGEETALLSSPSSKTMVMKSDGFFTRNLYDQEYRLQSRLTWQEEGSSTDSGNSPLSSKIVLQEDYFYYENSRNRQKVVLTDFTDTSRTERFYSLEGLVTREEFYGPDSENASSSQDVNLQDANPQDVNPLDANPQDANPDVNEQEASDFSRLALKKVTEYFYNPERNLTETRITLHGQDEAFVQKTLYHSPGNIHGGYDYFENDTLLVSRKYEDESVCTETRYFDNMKIEARYNGARLLSEVVYLDGKEIRRTEY